MCSPRRLYHRRFSHAKISVPSRRTRPALGAASVSGKTWLLFSESLRMEPSPKPRETISRFEKLLAALVTNRVDFAVAGGLAVIFNGYPRLTLDADILDRKSTR